MPELEKLKETQGKQANAARASTTDAEATVMQMGDGGLRPAYNAQYAIDTERQVIVGVEVVTVGSDMGQLAPMVEHVTERGGETPGHWLVDGGYPAHEQLEAAAEHTALYAPVPTPKAPADDPHAPQSTDRQAVAEWPARMGTAEAKTLYKERAATAECANAVARARFDPIPSSRPAQSPLYPVAPCLGAQPDADLRPGTPGVGPRDRYAGSGSHGPDNRENSPARALMAAICRFRGTALARILSQVSPRRQQALQLPFAMNIEKFTTSEAKQIRVLPIAPSTYFGVNVKSGV